MFFDRRVSFPDTPAWDVLQLRTIGASLSMKIRSVKQMVKSILANMHTNCISRPQNQDRLMQVNRVGSFMLPMLTWIRLYLDAHFARIEFTTDEENLRNPNLDACRTLVEIEIHKIDGVIVNSVVYPHVNPDNHRLVIIQDRTQTKLESAVLDILSELIQKNPAPKRRKKLSHR